MIILLDVTRETIPCGGHTRRYVGPSTYLWQDTETDEIVSAVVWSNGRGGMNRQQAERIFAKAAAVRKLNAEIKAELRAAVERTKKR